VGHLAHRRRKIAEMHRCGRRHASRCTWRSNQDLTPWRWFFSRPISIVLIVLLLLSVLGPTRLGQRVQHGLFGARAAPGSRQAERVA
jgi:hypothetical protein